MPADQQPTVDHHRHVVGDHAPRTSGDFLSDNAALGQRPEHSEQGEYGQAKGGTQGYSQPHQPMTQDSPAVGLAQVIKLTVSSLTTAYGFKNYAAVSSGQGSPAFEHGRLPKSASEQLRYSMTA